MIRNERTSPMRKFLQVLIFLLIAGCATLPPVIRDIKTQQIVKANYNRVWVPVNSFFNERKIPVRTVSIPDGSLETETVKIPYENYAYESDYCDCGTLGGIYVYREITGTYNVTIKGITKSTTSVTLNADYRAALWAGNTFSGWVRCQSKGLVEKAFFEKLSSVFQEKPEGKEESGEEEKPAQSQQPG